VSDFFAQLALAGNVAADTEVSSRVILEAIPLGIMIFDASRELLFANTAALSSLPVRIPDSGISLRQLREMFRLVDPDTERDVPPEQTPLARAFRDEPAGLQEFMLYCNNLARRSWIEMSAHPLRDKAGAISRAMVTFRGIGERKKRELAQDEVDRLHSIIYQENLAGIIRVTVDGRILDCNGAIIRMLGFKSKRELLVLRAPQIYYDPADRDRILRLLAGSRRISEVEVCLRRQDGARCWVLLNARLLDPPPGEVGGSIVSNLIDITERKKQEETLRKSEQRFADFMRHMPGVAFIKDLAGKYVFYNQAAWTCFRKRPEDMVGKSDEDIFHGDDGVRYRQNDLSVIQSGMPSEFVERIAHPDGQHTWLMYKFPIVEHGKVTLVGGIGLDVTERTILEEQLTQARKMEALGRLAGGVAHDFNNLLMVIAGYGQLAIETLGNVPTERIAVYMREILESSRRASALTGQLLAFSRRQALHLEVFDLGDLLRGMERMLQRLIGEQVELTVKSSGTDCLIKADKNQMEQAIMNLAANARDAMPLGGALCLQCDRLPEPIPQEDGEPFQVVLEVTDTGVGMDSAVQSKIFDPFFTSKEPGRGTGLGLSTVYGVVSQAKGIIEVESIEGEGTVFRLYFPGAAAAGDATVPARNVTTPRGRENVLLVEDEASVRALAETILKRLGYNVMVADSGAEALLVWEQRSGAIDVLLTDVIMPHMSGGDLAHKLREKNPQLRVLFMSGYTHDMIASHGVLAGETQLIQKPFTAEALGRKLRAVLDA
jgi:PAS domain S-box-containing protein